MRLKIAYVLVSSEKDYFLEQTMLAAYSASRYNPMVEIVVVADADTVKSMTNERARLKEYVTDIISVDVPSGYSMMQRSRFLKTNLPEYVSGDFIYMDSDTVVSGSLSDIYTDVQDLGLVIDQNLEEYPSDIKSWVRGNCEEIGWQDLSSEKAYNGGMIVFKRTAKAVEFFRRWHENWKECCSRGYDRDQLALTKANKECGYVFAELDGKYNCQVTKFESDRYKADVRIIHYYNLEICHHIYNDLKLWNKFKRDGVIPEEFLKSVDNPQTVLAGRFIKAYENDIRFLHSEWYSIYTNYPALQKRLLPCCLAICKVWNVLRGLKNKLS